MTAMRAATSSTASSASDDAAGDATTASGTDTLRRMKAINARKFMFLAEVTRPDYRSVGSTEDESNESPTSIDASEQLLDGEPTETQDSAVFKSNSDSTSVRNETSISATTASGSSSELGDVEPLPRSPTPKSESEKTYKSATDVEPSIDLNGVAEVAHVEENPGPGEIEGPHGVERNEEEEGFESKIDERELEEETIVEGRNRATSNFGLEESSTSTGQQTATFSAEVKADPDFPKLPSKEDLNLTLNPTTCTSCPSSRSRSRNDDVSPATARILELKTQPIGSGPETTIEQPLKSPTKAYFARVADDTIGSDDEGHLNLNALSMENRMDATVQKSFWHTDSQPTTSAHLAPGDSNQRAHSVEPPNGRLTNVNPLPNDLANERVKFSIESATSTPENAKDEDRKAGYRLPIDDIHVDLTGIADIADDNVLQQAVVQLERQLRISDVRCSRLERICEFQQQDIDSLRYEVDWKDARIDYLQKALAQLEAKLAHSGLEANV